MNREEFLYLNSFAHYSDALDFTVITFGEYMPYVFILVIVYLYFGKRYKNEAIFAFYSVIVSLGLNKIIDQFYFHNRPFMDEIGTVLKAHVAENSFPSDHTTFMFAIVWSLLFYNRVRKLSMTLIVFALVGSFARVVMGVHYPYDIFGGMFSGFLGALIAYLLRGKLQIVNDLIIRLDDKIIKTISSKKWG